MVPMDIVGAMAGKGFGLDYLVRLYQQRKQANRQQLM